MLANFKNIFYIILFGVVIFVLADHLMGAALFDTKTTPNAVARKHETVVPGPPGGIEKGRREETRTFVENDILRVGVNLEWGGAISEISHNGINLIDDNDTGRLVQVSVYDSNDTYFENPTDPAWGWNPVQGGDKYFHGSPVLDFEKTENSMRIKTRPLQWNPDNKGGGADAPVESEVLIDTGLALSSRWPQIIEVSHKIKLKKIRSITGNQEIPALFANSFLNKIVGFKGDEFWRFGGGGILFFEAPLYPEISVVKSLSEKWISLVNEKDFGITLYTPNHPVHTPIIPGISFFHKGGYNVYRTKDAVYVSPGLPNITLRGRKTYDIKYYIIVGNYYDARSLAKELRASNFNID